MTHGDLGAKLQSPYDHPEPDEATGISIFAQIRLTEQDVKRLQDAGLNHMIVRRGAGEQPGYYLHLRPDGTCTALSPSKLCSIHPHRPTVCRAFPFYFDLFAGLSMVSSCPGVGAGSSTVRELETEINAALEMYEWWVKKIRVAMETLRKPAPVREE